MVKVVSFNCNSIRNNVENVKNLLNNNDIVCLQEIMLSKSDLPILNDFNDNFNNVAFVNDRESLGINEGRPARGVAIYWRKSLSANILPVTIDDSIIGFLWKEADNSVLLLNVYLPCDKQTAEALHDYRCSLASLKLIIEEQNVNSVILVGDFNADPTKGRFWKELLDFVQSMLLVVLHDQLPHDSFTYLCPARNTTSWLDHVICSKTIMNKISNVRIDYTGAIYDHFPLCFDLDLRIDNTQYVKDRVSSIEFVNWQKITDLNKFDIKMRIDDIIKNKNLLNREVFDCSVIYCKNVNHHRELDCIFSNLKSLLLESTSEFSITRNKKFKAIPGWNDYVKEFYAAARDKFLLWKEGGKPSNGPLIEMMKTTRAQFKAALNSCKWNEDQIRRERLLENLSDKDFSGFWREVHSLKKNNNPSLYSIDGEKQSETIASLFSKKYKAIFDIRNRGRSDAEDFNDNLNMEKDEISKIMFSGQDIHSAIKLLKHSIGHDSIHSNHLKFCSTICEKLIGNLFSSFVLHGYMSYDTLKGVINPTVKDHFGDLQNSDNYRPVMSSSVFLKLFEYCMLEKIRNIVSLNDRQHGFRAGCSTSTAFFVLKETIMNYNRSNSNVYACFIDISKAFDSVNHKILLRKLLEQGIPKAYINIIKYWYANQFVKVRYGSSLSEEWRICNGVRQGGVLSGLLFSIYIDSLLSRISDSKFGCRLGMMKSNIVAYADDIVLLAPSATSLQILVDIAYEEANVLELSFNIRKSKCMVFSCSGNMPGNVYFNIANRKVDNVTSFKYLGFIVNSKLRNSDDIDRCMKKFYQEFNVILRKFHFADCSVKLFLFKQYCLQFYGSELWFGDKRSSANLRQFAVGYHKAAKKLLGLSYHESNHFACQEAGLFTFENLLNKIRIYFVLRLMTYSCQFIRKAKSFLIVSSVLCNEIFDILKVKYDIESLVDNDSDALLARICYVQNHESQLRQEW